jgi:hypothetical protein
MLIGLVVWFASFGDYAVSECNDPNSKGADCSDWKGLLPDGVFATSYGKADEVIGCRICNYQMKAFSPDSECKIGYGVYATGASCILTFISSWLGGMVKSKQAKRGELEG